MRYPPTVSRLSPAWVHAYFMFFMLFSLILTAISTMGGGPGQIVPVFREAISKPFGNVWISLCYTFNNLLYFDALSSISAVAYQAHRPTPPAQPSPRGGPLQRRTPLPQGSPPRVAPPFQNLSKE